jgi:hypothetical protein
MLRALIALGVATFAGSAAVAQVSAGAHPGFGSDTRRPQGTPFALPAGLEIAGPIMGADDDGNCPKPRTRNLGSGLEVRVCVPIRNRTGGGITVIFPPGLVIVSASETYQNGVLVEREVVTIPPTVISGNRLRDKDESDIVYVPLHTYCLNKAKATSTSEARFELGPVSSHAAMSELYAYMVGKDFKDYRDRVEELQEVVWDILRHGRFTAEHRADLDKVWALPPLR